MDLISKNEGSGLISEVWTGLCSGEFWCSWMFLTIGFRTWFSLNVRREIFR